ncbi:MAG: hypothetical protein M3O50_01155 [Myxococcota bacterium]|nr:hypothetical protein [Myxococcota bacterium]
MSEDKPSPLQDAVKGVGLLFRAAKNVAVRLPTKGLEDAVMTSAREVGRAIENVAARIDAEISRQTGFGKKGAGQNKSAAGQAANNGSPPVDAAPNLAPPKPAEPKPPDGA